MNPTLTDQLTQLTMGALPTGRRCHTMHCRLRYFDPDRRRAGLPLDVGALVERISDESVTVSLVNLSPVNERTVVIQGGGYAVRFTPTYKGSDYHRALHPLRRTINYKTVASFTGPKIQQVS